MLLGYSFKGKKQSAGTEPCTANMLTHRKYQDFSGPISNANVIAIVNIIWIYTNRWLRGDRGVAKYIAERIETI